MTPIDRWAMIRRARPLGLQQCPAGQFGSSLGYQNPLVGGIIFEVRVGSGGGGGLLDLLKRLEVFVSPESPPPNFKAPQQGL
eukprot:CAMPEP_0206466210 /NCGR_PEP_ID=MMETSP0324_2-20121206/28318_1 /ASSEMBLY_ACC=CAM_ASM_000836 /TAXON_ID=2866 /ORGANISM="Crypthecodinium cohnii, Strain Seligo" /LENGTH=81 /DNA_ID=CAMNT_0053939273 /DNA_START=256 /DNA_END=502 /DNA_ORIENTATION=+